MKCFYHNDMDGRCAGAIVADYTGNYNKDDYHEVDYVMDLTPFLNDIFNGETVYFVDYCFKENTKWVLDFLLEKQCDIVWIDHHTDSIKLDEKYKFPIRGIRKEGFSGALLSYMYLNELDYDHVPTFVKLVSDYDCWQYKFGEDTTLFKIGIESELYDALDNVWTDLLDEDSIYANDKFISIVNKGRIIKGYIDRDNAIYLKNYGYESIIDGHKCYVINKKTNSWIFGDKYQEYPCVVVWVFNGERYTYSIFSSNPEIDCSEIAGKFGGGGHKGAAGFSSDRMLFYTVSIQ